MVRGFLTDWNRSHPATTGQFGDVGTEHVSGIEWLASETRRLDGGVGVSPSTIEHVLAGRYRTTELRVADPIATALGQTYEISEGGALEPFPNPNAPRNLRGGSDGRCGCGGSESQLSLTGVALPDSC